MILHDFITLQSLQHRKLLLQITQKLNQILIESIFMQIFFVRYRIEPWNPAVKKEIETNTHAH